MAIESGNTNEAPAGESGRKKRDNRSDWIEIFAAVLLALATVCTAWSGYQATRWSGVMTIDFSASNAARVESTEASSRAYTAIIYDAMIFADYATAFAEGDEALQQYMEENLFRAEFKKAVDAWKAMDPLSNPDAPRTPFEMKEYTSESLKESLELNSDAEEKTENAKAANQQSDNYVLATVIFASVLFFAGISTKFKGKRVRIAMITMGAVVFIVSSIFVFQMPIH